MCFSFFHGFSQTSDIENLASEFKFLAGNFAEPAANGAAYQASAGWFSSAAASDLWAVDISVHGNILFVPEKRRNFQISNAAFAEVHPGVANILSVKGAESAEVPSAFGGATDVFFQGEIFGQNFEFQSLEGINKKIILHPFVQASVGLPLGTEFSLRYLPKVTVDGVDFNTYGIGLKHNLNQYFRNSYPSDFQFAAVLTYSKFDVDYAFLPVEIPGFAKMEAIAVNADIWLGQFLASKAFMDSGWEVFAALGATTASFNYELGGNGIGLPAINSELKSLSKNDVEVKADLGFNYKYQNFMLSSMFSVGKFFNYNLGLHYKL